MADKIKRGSGAVIGGGASVQNNDRKAIDALFEIVSITDFTARSQTELLSLDASKRGEEKAGRIKGALSVTADTDRTLRQEVESLTGRSFSDAPKTVECDFAKHDMAEILFFIRHHPVIVLRSARSEKAHHGRILRIEFGLRIENDADYSYTASICIENTDTGHRASSKDIALAVNDAATVALKRYLQECEKHISILPLAQALSDLEKAILECGKQEDSESALVCALTPRDVASSGFVTAGDSLIQEMRDRIVDVVKDYADILRPYAERKRAK